MKYQILAMGAFMLTAPLCCDEIVAQKSETPAPMKQSIKDLNADNFQSTLQERPYVIVDVYSERCGACKKFDPVFQELNRNYGDRYNFAKLKSSQANNALMDTLHITAFPTIIFFKNGQEVDRVIGYTDADTMVQKAQAAFKS